MKRFTLVRAGAVTLMLLTTMGAAPAANSAPVPESPTEECGGHAESATLLGRGGLREPELGQVHEDLPASAIGKAPKGFKVNVPVYVHVITDGTTGALTDSQIATQIAVLNNTYAGGEGGARSGFSFTLAGVTRTDNAAWFTANPGGTNEHSMKQALHQGGPNALNFYSTTAGDYLGWAYLPDIVTKPGQAYLDGVVIDWESIPGTSTAYAGRYDQGETATHEVGHWLNLEHTFFGGCNAKGDFVDDTPAQKTPTSGCPEGKDTCRAPGLDPIHNYMDYSYDSCYTQFTPGQVQRMGDAWLLYRAG
ncbi:zinc metalloprotease [Kribbella sp. NPDC023855]|uniref:zinc metalloprotease n=1 Tax=Kribbella sp. NPDC023855 TaxID=3154698 RepID=UPI0033F15F8D